MELALTWSGESPVFDSLEADDFVYETCGRILDAENEKNPTLVGTFKTLYVDAERAADTGCSLFNLQDSHDAVSSACAAVLEEGGWSLNDCTIGLLGDKPISLNILVIDRLKLLPDFRGKGLGLKVLSHIIHRFGQGAALAAIKPFPLQFVGAEDKEPPEHDPAMQYGSFKTDKKSSIEALCRYYERAGFRPVPDTGIMIGPA